MVAKAPPSKRLETDLKRIVGPHSNAYARTFLRFQPAGRFVFTWNWPAAVLGEVWFAYRKMYGLAAGVLVLDLAALWAFQQLGWPLWVRFAIGAVVIGPIANWLYFLHTTRLLQRIRAGYTPGDEAEDMMRHEGGVSMQAVVMVMFLGMFVQPVLEGRWFEHELGVFARNYEFNWFADVRRLYFW